MAAVVYLHVTKRDVSNNIAANCYYTKPFSFHTNVQEEIIPILCNTWCRQTSRDTIGVTVGALSLMIQLCMCIVHCTIVMHKWYRMTDKNDNLYTQFTVKSNDGNEIFSVCPLCRPSARQSIWIVVITIHFLPFIAVIDSIMFFFVESNIKKCNLWLYDGVWSICHPSMKFLINFVTLLFQKCLRSSRRN